MTDERPLGLRDEDYWETPRAAADGLLGEWMLAGTLGTACDAPEYAPLSRETLPVVGCHVVSAREGRAYTFAEAAIVVAADVLTGDVHAAPAFAPRDAEPRPETSDDPGEGASGVTFEIDLRERIALPARDGVYVVYLVCRGAASNRVRVQVGPAPGEYRDPEVARYITERLRTAPLRELWPMPGAPLPTFHHVAVSPPVPDGIGIALAADRVVMLEPSQRAVVAGSFRLPVRPQERVRDARIPGLPDATAVVPITLLVTGTEAAGPRVYRMAVPVFTELRGDGADAVATGHFTVDLRTLPGMWQAPQTCWVYAAAGEALSAPATVGFVASAMIPTAVRE